MVVYRRYPDKALKDSYTPAVIKAQTMLMALSLLFFILSPFIIGFFYLALLAWGAIVASSFPFSLKTFRKDKPVGLISPGIVLLRSLVFAVGSLSGMVKHVL